MSRLLPATLVMVALLASPPGFSQRVLDDGTYDVYEEDISAEGHLEGCSLVFTTIATDNAYSGGKKVLLNGSVALRTLGQKDLLFAGKLGTRKILPGGPGPWESPQHFHFFSKTGSTAGLVKIADAETAGFRLLIGRATDDGIMKLINDMADSSEFSVGFNRKQGGQDVTSHVNMKVGLKRGPNGEMRLVENPQTSLDYASCVSRLIDGLVKKITPK